MKIIAVYTLVGPVTVLAMTALAVITNAGRAGLTTNAGAHGFTEILFAYASAFANNGQSMAGLSANNIFYNITTIVAMLAGRYVLAVLALALAGQFAAVSRRAPSRGAMPSDGITFGVLLTSTALLVGARAEAQAPMGESEVKAMFVYNFLKFVEWAPNEDTGR